MIVHLPFLLKVMFSRSVDVPLSSKIHSRLKARMLGLRSWMNVRAKPLALVADVGAGMEMILVLFP